MKISELFALILLAVSAQAQPTANFTANLTQGCAPLVVNFTDQSTGNPNTWSWDFGIGTSTQRNPSVAFISPGTYTIRLTVANAQGTDMEEKMAYIHVYDTPMVSFTATPLQACVGTPVLFSDNSQTGGSTSNSYLWDFGDGTPFGTIKNPTHSYSQAGPKTITLRVTNQWGCSRTLTRPQYVQVDSAPAVNFVANKTVICGAETIHFTSSVQGNAPYTYAWTFGSLGNSNQANPSFLFPSTPGSHTIGLEVTDSRGCVRSVVKPNYINRIEVSASINSPNSACEGSSVSFSATSNPSSSVKYWNFGDGSPMVSGNSRAHVYSAAGNYEVTLIAVKDGCADTVKKTIQILPKPKADFTVSPRYPCTVPAQIQFSPVGSFSGYQWDFGVVPAATSTQANPSHTYNQPGIYSPGLIVTHANGCRDTITKNAHVQLHPGTVEIHADSTGGCGPLPIAFSFELYSDIPTPFSPYPQPPASCLWDFRDGYTSTSMNPTHIFQDTGIFMVTLRLTTANGCVFQDSIEIKVGRPPLADFKVVPDQACVRSEVNFVNLSVGADSFRWDFGDGRNSSIEDPIHLYDSAGTFDILLTAYHHSCPDTQLYPALVQIDSPLARFEYMIDCDTITKVRFLSTSYGETSFIWYFGDNTTNNSDRELVHYYPSEGNYRVMLVAFNSRSGCSDTQIVDLPLFTPEISLTASDTLVCVNDTIHFLGQRVPAGYEIRRQWAIDGINRGDTVSTLRFIPSAAGKYTIRYSFEDENGCRREITRTDYVRASRPTVDFSGDPLWGCDPLTVQFADLSQASPGSTLAQWTWSFGDGGGQSSGNAPAQHTYLQPGLYDVSLTVVDNAGCTHSLEKKAYIDVQRPVLEFMADSTVCRGAPASFIPLQDGFPPFYWDFGDGNHSSQETPQHIYSDTGSYTIRFSMANQYGCRDTVEIPHRVKVKAPTADFRLSDTLSACLPFPVTMTNTSSRSQIWYWDFGNGTQQRHTSINTPANVMYVNSGEYTITLVAEDASGCRDTARRKVYVLGYSGLLDYSPLTGCAPLEVHFTNQVYNVANLQYDFDDGVVVSAQSGQPFTHTYQSPGKYRPRLVITDNSGCSVGSSGLEDILVDGLDVHYEMSPACVGQEIEFRDHSVSHFSGKNFWAWIIDGQSGSNPREKATFPKAGIYDLKLVVGNANGCKDSLVGNFEVHDLPTISAGGDTIICAGDYAQLQAIGAVEYRWTPVDLLSCADCPNPLAHPSRPTEFTVIGTDEHGCSDTDQVIIEIKTHVEAEASGGGEICLGESRLLKASGASLYQWSPSESLSQAQGDSTTAQPATSTRYRMVAYEGSCVPDTHYLEVTVHPLPEVEASGSVRTVAGKEVPIQAQGKDIERFLWSPSSSLSCEDCSSPQARPLKTTRYTVTVFNEFGCQDSSSVTIEVFCDQSQIFVPNTFTPNGDGQNDRFYPRGIGLAQARIFRVYNRWGEMLFEARNIAFNDAVSGWDGRFQGRELNPDVFVWFLEAECESGEVIQLKGDISLVR